MDTKIYIYLESSSVLCHVADNSSWVIARAKRLSIFQSLDTECCGFGTKVRYVLNFNVLSREVMAKQGSKRCRAQLTRHTAHAHLRPPQHPGPANSRSRLPWQQAFETGFELILTLTPALLLAPYYLLLYMWLFSVRLTTRCTCKRPSRLKLCKRILRALEDKVPRSNRNGLNPLRT